jgi:hypothetical protein
VRAHTPAMQGRPQTRRGLPGAGAAAAVEAAAAGAAAAGAGAGASALMLFRLPSADAAVVALVALLVQNVVDAPLPHAAAAVTDVDSEMWRGLLLRQLLAYQRWRDVRSQKLSPVQTASSLGCCFVCLPCCCCCCCCCWGCWGCWGCCCWGCWWDRCPLTCVGFHLLLPLLLLLLPSVEENVALVFEDAERAQGALDFGAECGHRRHEHRRVGHNQHV